MYANHQNTWQGGDRSLLRSRTPVYQAPHVYFGMAKKRMSPARFDVDIKRKVVQDALVVLMKYRVAQAKNVVPGDFLVAYPRAYARYLSLRTAGRRSVASRVLSPGDSSAPRVFWYGEKTREPRAFEGARLWS